MLGPQLSKNQIEAVKQAQSDSNNPQGFPAKTPVSDKNPIEKARDAIDRLKRKEDRDRLHGCIFKNIGCMGLDPLELLVKIFDGNFEPCRDAGICQKGRCNGCCTNEPCCGKPDCDNHILISIDLWSDVDSITRPSNDVIDNIKAPEIPVLADQELGIIGEYMDAYAPVCPRCVVNGLQMDGGVSFPDNDGPIDASGGYPLNFGSCSDYYNEIATHSGTSAVLSEFTWSFTYLDSTFVGGTSVNPCADLPADVIDAFTYDGEQSPTICSEAAESYSNIDISFSSASYTVQKQSLPPISGQQVCGSFWETT